MKKLVSLTIATLLVLSICLGSIGAAAENTAVQPKWSVPAGYNQQDYNKLAAFLEIADDDGVKNGVKCAKNYDPNEPSTWGRAGNADDPENHVEPVTFTWTEQNGEKRITEITCYNTGVVGSLDVSNCEYLVSLNCASNELSALNVLGCVRLSSLLCSSNGISSLNIATCTALVTLACDNNALSSLNVSANSALRSLTVSRNRLGSLNLASNSELVALNCTGCALTSLSLGAQGKLLGLYCAENDLSSLDLSALTKLQFINCRDNSLSQLNVSASTLLLGLNCDGNLLTSLDLSSNRLLVYLSCLENRLTDLDLAQTRLGFDSVHAETCGTIGYSASITVAGNDNMPVLNNSVHAHPSSGYTFTGWYGASGAQLSTAQEFVITASDERSFTARFTPISNPNAGNGDVDGNAIVNIADAVLALRKAIGVLDLTAEQIARGDIDGNGSINVADAISIMRIAMGIN